MVCRRKATRMQVVLTGLIAIMAVMAVNGQTKVWMTYDTSNCNIASNRLNCVAVDSQGNIWVGSSYGLSKFDGASWTSYNTTNTSGGLLSNNVFCIAADANAVWFGTSGGVSKLTGSAWSKYTEPNLTSNEVRCMAVQDANTRWFGTAAGVTQFSGTSTFTKYTNSSTGGGLPHDWVYGAAVDASGYKWFGTYDGVGRLNSGNSSWTTYTDQNLVHKQVYAVAANGAELWFGTRGGVSKYASGNWTNYTTTQGLADNMVNAVAFDATGKKWFGTLQGISVFGTSWTTYDTSNGLAAQNVKGIARDKADNMWCATFGGGLSVLGVDTVKPSVTLKSPTGSEKWSATSQKRIEWSVEDHATITTRKIYYKTNPTGAWALINSAQGKRGDDGYTWTLPSDTADFCWIKVEAIDAGGNVGADSSDNAFQIVVGPHFTCPDSVSAEIWKPFGMRLTIENPSGSSPSYVVAYPVWMGLGAADSVFGTPNVLGVDTIVGVVDVDGATDTIRVRVYVMDACQIYGNPHFTSADSTVAVIWEHFGYKLTYTTAGDADALVEYMTLPAWSGVLAQDSVGGTPSVLGCDTLRARLISCGRYVDTITARIFVIEEGGKPGPHFTSADSVTAEVGIAFGYKFVHAGGGELVELMAIPAWMGAAGADTVFGTPGIAGVDTIRARLIASGQYVDTLIVRVFITDPSSVLPVAAGSALPKTMSLALSGQRQGKVEFMLGFEKNSTAHLHVYDLQGRMVWQQVFVHMEPGYYQVSWDAAQQHINGTYLALVKRGQERIAKRFVISR